VATGWSPPTADLRLRCALRRRIFAFGAPFEGWLPSIGLTPVSPIVGMAGSRPPLGTRPGQTPRQSTGPRAPVGLSRDAPHLGYDDLSAVTGNRCNGFGDGYGSGRNRPLATAGA
jgi:hypothetical protein